MWRNVKDFEDTLQKRITKKRRASDAERERKKETSVRYKCNSQFLALRHLLATSHLG